MVGFEAEAGKAALDEAKTLIDALLGPKIARLKKWTLEKDVEGQVKSKALAETLCRYLSRVLPNAATIQSIVFPQQRIPLSAIYQPITMETNSFLSSAKQILSDIDIVNTEEHITIIDAAGMGKSTFSKWIFIKICELSDCVPIHFNLRYYTGKDDLINHLRHELDEINASLSSDLFARLLLEGKFFIILDGFDEVNANFQAQARQDIEGFSWRCGKAKIILTSRPQDNLPIITDGLHYHFRRFRKQEAAALIRRYDSFANLNFSKRLIKKLKAVPEPLLQTPLLVALLYRVFGVSGKIDLRITTYFDDIYKTLYEGHDLTKAGWTRAKKSGLNIDDFRRLLRALSYSSMVRQQFNWANDDQLLTAIEAAAGLCSLDKSVGRSFMHDILTAVPYFVRDGNELKFVHKTFQEYFAAEFIISNPGSLERIEKIVTSPVAKSFLQVFDYLYEMQPSLGRRAFAVPAAKFVVAKEIAGPLSIKDTLKFVYNIKLQWTDRPRSSFRQKKEEDRQYIRLAYPDFDFTISTRSIGPFSQLPAAAWKEISKIITVTDESGGGLETFEKKVKMLRKGLFHPGGNSTVDYVLSDNFFIRAFCSKGGGLIPSPGKNLVFVISRDACDDVLLQNEREGEAMRAIDELL